jgi:hypothetical protein
MDKLTEIRRTLRRSAVPDGLCAQRGDHPDHEHTSESLGRFWCTGREADREPGRSERQRAAQGVVNGIRPHLPMTPEELAERERVMLSLPITPFDPVPGQLGPDLPKGSR